MAGDDEKRPSLFGLSASDLVSESTYPDWLGRKRPIGPGTIIIHPDDLNSLALRHLREEIEYSRHAELMRPHLVKALRERQEQGALDAAGNPATSQDFLARAIAYAHMRVEHISGQGMELCQLLGIDASLSGAGRWEAFVERHSDGWLDIHARTERKKPQGRPKKAADEGIHVLRARFINQVQQDISSHFKDNPQSSLTLKGGVVIKKTPSTAKIIAEVQDKFSKMEPGKRSILRDSFVHYSHRSLEKSVSKGKRIIKEKALHPLLN